MEIRQIHRRFVGANPDPAYLVSYAPEHNVTQAHIDRRTDAEAGPANRNSRIKRVSGDHPFVLDHAIPNTNNPDLFTAHYKDGPELASTLSDKSGKPGPLLREFLQQTDTTPRGLHARPGRILPTGVTPNTRSEAKNCADRHHWTFAELAEHDQLTDAGTWKLVKRSQARNVISGKWVYKIKRDSNGRITRYKARWVARGFSQREGIDYNEIFAPVVRYSSIRLLGSLANQHNLDAAGLDISNAFARATVSEDLYVEMPHGFEKYDKDGKPLVCKLVHGLYGTKQAARDWHHCFRSHLLADGWIPYESDPCVFSRRTPRFGLEYLSIYVDDGVHLSERPGAHDALIKYLNKAFPTTSQDELTEMLSMRFTRDRPNKKMWIDQSHGISDFLARWDIPTKTRLVTTPMDPSWEYGDEPPLTDPEKLTEYRSKCSSISYFAQVTRPDLAYSTSKLMSYMHRPNAACFRALDRLCNYLRRTSHMGLAYSASPNIPRLEAYCDASWNATFSDKGRSTSGYLFYYGKDLIDWSSKRQEIAALSPAESEQNAAFHTAKTAIYFRELLSELGYDQSTPTTLHEDNTACIAQSKNPVNHQRTRHVHLRYHYLRELVKQKLVRLQHIRTNQQRADALTKPLSPILFRPLAPTLIQPTRT